MIYIPHIKQRIDKLAPRWHQGKLKPEELNEFYDLLDEVVLEAREGRSDSIDRIDQRPEAFLINLFQQPLKRTIFAFFKRYKQHYAEAAHHAKKTDIKLDKTPVFLEWLSYATIITQSIILSDATKRRTRRDQIREYLKPLPYPTKTEDPISRSKDDFIKDRHLAVNNKRLFALKKDLIQQQNALKRESRQRQDNIEWNYAPWAEQCALNEGVGYNPDYKKEMLEDLSLRLEAAEDLTKRWEDGELIEDIKTRNELDDYLRSKYTGYLPSEIKRKIESLKNRRPNLVHFLFGSKKRKGELYWRLVELHRFITNRNKKEIVCDDFQEISDTEEYQKFVVNDMRETGSPTSDSDSNIDDDLEKKIEQFGLTKKQIIIFMMRIIDKKPISSIASELKISERAVFKHLANIRQNVNAKTLSKK